MALENGALVLATGVVSITVAVSLTYVGLELVESLRSRVGLGLP